jgi:hypothetical protein
MSSNPLSSSGESGANWSRCSVSGRRSVYLRCPFLPQPRHRSRPLRSRTLARCAQSGSYQRLRPQQRDITAARCLGDFSADVDRRGVFEIASQERRCRADIISVQCVIYSLPDIPVIPFCRTMVDIPRPAQARFPRRRSLQLLGVSNPSSRAAPAVCLWPRGAIATWA